MLFLNYYQLLWQPGDPPTARWQSSKRCSCSTSAPPVVVRILNEPVQSVTPTNIDNVSAAQRPASFSQEPTVFMTKTEIKAMFKRKTERASTTSTCLDLKPPYPDKVAIKQFASEYEVPKFL